MLHTHIIFLKRINSLALLSIAGLVGLFVWVFNPLPVVEMAMADDTVSEAVNLSLSTSTVDVKMHIRDLRGNFATSNVANIDVSTNNFTGYTLRMTGSSEEDYSKLKSEEYEIDSISEPTSGEDFTDNSWGVMPSKYNSEENELYLPAPTSEGFVIDKTGASNSTANTYTLGFAIKASEDIPAGRYQNSFSVTALSNPATYSISYGTDNAIVVTNIPADEYGFSDVTEINISDQIPVREEGYDFCSWCTGEVTVIKAQPDTCDDDTYRPGDPIRLNRLQDNDFELKTMWTPTTYNINYILDGGTSNNPTTYNIESDDIVLTAPTKNGYNFVGWTGSNGDTPELTVTIPSGSLGDKDYIANWEIINYDLSYNLNGGAVASANPVSYNVETASFTLNNPTRTGYNFKGWSGTGLNGDSNTTVTIGKGSTGNRSYTANWTPIVYMISYSGSNASNPTSYTIETATFTLNNPSKNGYNFKGWSGTGLSGDSNTSVTIPKGSIGNRSYTANYTVINYGITYNLAGGSVSPANPTSYNIETNTITLRNPTRGGYNFAGWTGTGISSSSTNVTIAKGSTGARSYTATWTPITYSISYDLAGGSVSPANPASYNIETNSFTLRNPTREGHTFAGWTGTGISGASTSVTIAKGSTGNRSYKATWTVNNYTLDLNGMLDGSSSGGISGFGTADVYINGSLVANDVADYYAAHPYNSTYEIKDIKATSGKQYDGVYSGNTSGTIKSNLSVVLKFSTIPCTFTSKAFNYTGGVQSWTVPVGCSGTYLLEVWGAQGGGRVYNTGAATGGKGGYAKGTVSLTAGSTIYVVVGGQGNSMTTCTSSNSSASTAAGGYNGGGYIMCDYYNGNAGSGGGATHIGTFNSTLAAHGNTSGLYIVAGGGGGGGPNAADNGSSIPYGGIGGGASGGNGTGLERDRNNGVYGYGGSQTAGGRQPNRANGDPMENLANFNYGSFGQGGSQKVVPHSQAVDWGADTTGSYNSGAGGGGGLYGGGAGLSYSGSSPSGGGGSGYTGGVSGGSMTSGAREGNGYAKITKQ